jgi:hypothetical protein
MFVGSRTQDPHVGFGESGRTQPGRHRVCGRRRFPAIDGRVDPDQFRENFAQQNITRILRAQRSREKQETRKPQSHVLFVVSS